MTSSFCMTYLQFVVTLFTVSGDVINFVRSRPANPKQLWAVINALCRNEKGTKGKKYKGMGRST